MYKYLFIFILIVLWIYTTLCLFFIGMGGDFYIKSIPIMNIGEPAYQIYNFIPLCLFTTYFDKKIYIQD